MLYDRSGLRKYLSGSERQAFCLAAQQAAPMDAAFALTLFHTGCRISEALALSRDRVDFAEGMLIFESLKKRRRGIYRSVPVPPALLESLKLMSRDTSWNSSELLWPWARSTASLRIAELMAESGISGVHACPKGLRHGFAIACIEAEIPLNVIQKWLGHAQLSTTAIYAAVVGNEEKRLAERLWNK